MPLSEEIRARSSGMVTYPDTITDSPFGSTLFAKNLKTDRPGILRKRTGRVRQNIISPDFFSEPLASAPIRLVTYYKNRTVSIDASSRANSCQFPKGVLQPLGPTASNSSCDLPFSPDVWKPSVCDGSGNKYFMGRNGLTALTPGDPEDSPGGIQIRNACNMASYVPILSENTDGDDQFLQPGYQVAYKTVVVAEDGNGRIIYGPPSQRAIIKNEGDNPINVNVYAYTIPPAFALPQATGQQLIPFKHRIYFYRTPIYPLNVDPGDAVFLVSKSNFLEDIFTPISFAYLLDSYKETSLGEALYTNAGIEGASQSNDAPPLSYDMCQYKNFFLYANVRFKQSIFITMSKNAVAGEWINLDNIKFVGGYYEDLANRIFKVSNDSDEVTAIDETCRSIERCVIYYLCNHYSAATGVEAFYLSGGTASGSVGTFSFSRPVLGMSEFSFFASNPEKWNPIPLVAPGNQGGGGGSDIKSSDGYLPDGVSYSKNGNAEYVPGFNVFRAGLPGYQIRRIMPLRDSVVLLKDDGIIILSGDSPDGFRQTKILTNCTVVNPWAATTDGQYVYAHMSNGYFRISAEGGAEEIGIPINDFMLDASNQYGIGIAIGAYSSIANSIFYFYNKSSQPDGCDLCLVYNTRTQQWSVYDIPSITSCSGSDGYSGLIFGDSRGVIKYERSELDGESFIDDALNLFIQSKEVIASGVRYTVLPYASWNIDDLIALFNKFTEDPLQYDFIGNINGISNGWMVRSGSGEYFEISEVDYDSGTFVISKDYNLDAEMVNNSFRFVLPIETEIKFGMFHGNVPVGNKRNSDATIIMADSNASSVEIGFSSPYFPNPSFVEIPINRMNGWGSEPWGSEPWGGGYSKPISFLRTLMPISCARAPIFFVHVREKQLLRDLEIMGVSARYYSSSPRLTR